MNVIIGGAWPYANGALHIGHIAALLPGDVLARHHRAIGNQVCYVSGSDCHGTPVSIKARQEGVSPADISERWHASFEECFAQYLFSYDAYGKTSSALHRDFVTGFHKSLYAGTHVEERVVQQAWCPQCNRFLADRYVTGKCPRCGEPARGDQCEACGTVTEPETLVSPVCAICGHTPEFRESKQLFLLLSHFQKQLADYLTAHSDWRRNAYENTARYIREGLRDRAITRDLDWGIPVPREGYDDKRIYIWAENVLGYLSGCAGWCALHGLAFRDFWNSAWQIQVHGKDNIPFHTVILPGLLLAEGDGRNQRSTEGNGPDVRQEESTGKDTLRLPDQILSSEYLTLEGRKISTSGNWSIDALELAGEAPIDSIRYFLLANGPEKRDADFSRRDFIQRHNSEIIGVYGNLVNRCLAFVEKYLDGQVPIRAVSPEIVALLEGAYETVGREIRAGELKNALDTAFGILRFGNRHFDAGKPWETRTSDPEACKATLSDCLFVIVNACRLLNPFLPDSTAEVLGWFGLETGWGKAFPVAGTSVAKSRRLFERLETLADAACVRNAG